MGLHCLPRPICLKTKDHYGIDQIEFNEGIRLMCLCNIMVCLLV